MKELLSAKKIKIIFILAFMSSLAPLSTDMYLPALSEVQIAFHTNPFYMQLSIVSFFLAFSLGQLIYGPISDVYGRKIPLYVGLIIFIVSTFACLSVDSIYAFIVFRFLQALGGCAGVVITMAIVNDNFSFKEASSIFALIMVTSSLAPMLSPTFGSLLLDYFSWKSIFTTLFILGIILLLCVVFGLKDIKEKRNNLKLDTKHVLKNYITILKDRRFRIYIFSSAFAMATIFAYIAGSSYIFREYYGLSEKAYGILFGLNAFSFIIFANINAQITLKYSYSPYSILPKAFFIMFIIALLLICVGIFRLHFVFFEILLFFMIGMLGFVAPNTTTLAMARFKNNSGSASALFGTTQFLIAGFVAFIVSVIEANSPLPLAFVIAMCLIVASSIYFFIIPRRR
ncbi:multidrug effflux MFS transporter [Helicobacter sp. WB40]|uniref:multidrug effflux MFS transporter n=1 Tax=Helicobacter sp. WB40 TaxID=3004130 RepID=UPI0022EBEA33|nr:multidrug effflux MFS transporter [Helicobacter sp. WB40]MDA3967974.1 multidrug effflux MFS transporter [Helicobacter sp. WB40]